MRLIPQSKTANEEGVDSSDDEDIDSENDDHDTTRRLESQVGSTMLEGGISLANSRMWMLGCSHLLTRNLSIGYNFEQSLIPIRIARVCRTKNSFMLRHDVSKEVATRISYTNIARSAKETTKFNGVEHEMGFKVT